MIKPLLKSILPEKTRLKLRFFWYKLTSSRYKGNLYHCNICEGNWKALKSHDGRFKRDNVKCPQCASLERQRLIMDYLVKKGYWDRSLKLLHFAPGFEVQKKFKRNSNWDYRSADLFSSIAMDKEDIQALSYSDNSFDLVIVAHVMSHVENDIKGYSEIARVLKSDGHLLLFDRVDENKTETFEDATANSPAMKLKIYGQDDLARIYGQDFTSRIKEGGLQVEIIDYCKELESEKVEKLRLNNIDLIYLCKPR